MVLEPCFDLVFWLVVGKAADLWYFMCATEAGVEVSIDGVGLEGGHDV